MIEYIEFGNIFKINGVKNYAHGCNCAGAMGKGIAVQFKDNYPEMYKQYKEKCKNGVFKLGDVFAYNYGEGYIFNLGTQQTWKTKAELKAIEQSLINMLNIAIELNIKKIALPTIGAGLGGLKWQDVKKVIDTIGNMYPSVTLFVIENYQDTNN